MADKTWVSRGPMQPGGNAEDSRDIGPGSGPTFGGEGLTDADNIIFGGGQVEPGGNSFDVTD